MAIYVDIADRLYDYTDEEKAAQAIEEYQMSVDLEDATIISLWEDARDPRRLELERRIHSAVEMNGSARRAKESVPTEITLITT